MASLNLALGLNASAVEALWQRHLVFLAYGLDKRAVMDLVAMQKALNTPCYKLHRSRADIYFNLGNYQEAAANYQV